MHEMKKAESAFFCGYGGCGKSDSGEAPDPGGKENGGLDPAGAGADFFEDV